jgi:capsule polysaccharide export protein KpsE/RkpR
MRQLGGAVAPQTIPDVPHLPLPVNGDDPGKEQRPVAFLRLVWQNRRFMARVALYALLATAAIAFLISPRYESTAHLMPPDNSSGGSGLAMAAAAMATSVAGSALGGMATNLLGMKNNSDIFAGILASRTAQDKLIHDFDLQRVYHLKRMEDARKSLADHTSITIDRKSQIISIEVTDKSAQRAAAMCQAYVEQLNYLVAALSTSSARRERIFLEDRLKAVSQDLKTAEKNFSEFSSKNSAIDVKEQGRAMLGAAAVLQGNLIAAESEYEGLRQIYSDSNVRVRAIHARIGELRKQLEALAGKDESSTKLPGDGSDSLYPSIRKLPLLGVRYADLYRETKIQEAVLETLTREYEMAKVQEAKEIPTVKVLDPPQISDKKSFPPRLLIIFIGTLGALIAATIWLSARSAWQETDDHDERKLLAQEVFTDLRARLPQFLHSKSEQNGGRSLVSPGGRSSVKDEDLAE